MKVNLKTYNYNIFFVLLCLFVFAIPFKVNYGNITLIIATLYAAFFISKQAVLKKRPLLFYFPLFFFLVSILSSLISKNTFLGLERTDLEFLPVMFLIILVGNELDVERIKRLLFVFFVSTSFFTLILILVSVYNTFFGINSGTFHNFTLLYDQHPVYFSLYISISLCYLLIHFNEIIFKGHIIFKVITGLILFYGLILSASKAVIFFDLIMLFFYMILNLKKAKERLIGLLILAFIGVLVLTNSVVKDRFLNGLTLSSEVLAFEPTDDFAKKKLFSYDEKKNISDLELRYLFAKIAVYHAYKDNKLLFGYGQGDTQNYLDYYFYSYNLGPNWYEDYNVHNQYIHILITYGIFVLIVFLLYMTFSLYIAVINNNLLYLFFILICSFVFVFEVLLVRNKGIIFFYFFNTLFLTHYINFENSNTRNKRYTQ